MSTLAWVVIGVLVVICLVLVWALYAALNLGGELLSGFIKGLNGPDITKKGKR